MNSAERLLTKMAEQGGTVVCSSECTEVEIALARADERFAVVAEPGERSGYGFVLRKADR